MPGCLDTWICGLFPWDISETRMNRQVCSDKCTCLNHQTDVCILLATRWWCCIMLECEGRLPNTKSTSTYWRSPKSIPEQLSDIGSYWTYAHTYHLHRLNLWGEWTCLSGRWLHRIIVEDDVLQLPELPVGCRNLCDLIAGEVKSDERQVSQLCKQGWQHVKIPM